MAMSAITGLFKQGGDNFVRNVTGMWDGMRPRDYIRIIVIIGAYLLFRPYLLKFAAKLQARENEKQDKLKPSEVTTKLSPNQLRDGSNATSKLTQSMKKENNGEKSVVRRGDKSKKQKQATTKLDENKTQSELQGKTNIMDYLVDYEEGKDGW
ncbi:hypothetical protein K3495_g4168 [Podosphaera aphanis]|nr:hypothetical protein K3495_g4168 [Podosphaera aphanis]